ncbi:MAG: aminopeptidase P family protein [Atopobiaceae bacterium]|nr:aminopeptidase P family protein [Atopobiaceae bacterium]
MAKADQQDFCASRIASVRALMSERGYDAIIVRSNANLRWLTAATRVFDDEIAHAAFITADELYLHTDSRYFNSFVECLGSDGAWKIDEREESHAAWAAARIRETHARMVALEDSSDLYFFDSLKTEMDAASTAALLPRLHNDLTALRMVKDESELELMRHAQSITDAAFDHICTVVKAGMTELEIRAALEYYMFSHGADALSFASIVAAGPNGANPHAQPGERVVCEGDMLVLDYGAAYGDYRSDMTRTICVGAPTDEQVKVYNIVREAHERCAEAIHAGVDGKEIHELAVKIISDAGYGDYFKHGLGHGVGIEIHELPSLGRRQKSELVAGSVVTVEPGIYLPGNFGVRLEDCGLVTKDGYKPFTTSTHDLVCVG